MNTPERREKGLYWDRAWKLVEGCTKCSLGCDNCWSETETVMRSNHPNTKIRDRALIVTAKGGQDGEPVPQGCFTGNITMRHDNLNLPLTIKKPTVFAIWNDLYHKDVTAAFLKKAYQVMSDCPHHTFLVLTKRAERMAECCQGEIGRPENESHIYHGVTICNQDEADKNIPLLLQVPGKRFLSIEPMLGLIDLTKIALKESDAPEKGKPDVSINCLHGWYGGADHAMASNIHQVLLGGESGKNARPMRPDWVRSIRDQCQNAGAPFMFKQWGEWIVASDENLRKHNKQWDMRRDDCVFLDIDGNINTESSHGMSNNAFAMIRITKKKAGRTLDGKIHADLLWDESEQS